MPSMCTYVVWISELKRKERKRANKLKAARLRSCSENVDALRRETISENFGCRHVPGEGGGAGDGEGVGVDLARGVNGRGTKAFMIREHVPRWTIIEYNGQICRRYRHLHQHFHEAIRRLFILTPLVLVGGGGDGCCCG